MSVTFRQGKLDQLKVTLHSDVPYFSNFTMSKTRRFSLVKRGECSNSMG